VLRSFVIAAAALLSACSTKPAADAGPQTISETPDVIEVMVIGSWHMRTSNSNVIDVPGPDVLTPARQQEFDDIVTALARFAPTVVAVEAVTAAPSFEDPTYREFGEAMLPSDPGEEVQIGYRLASRLGLPAAYGIDEQPSDDEPDYFPIGRLFAFLEEQGEAEALQARFGELEQRVKAEMESFEELHLGEALARVNEGFLSDASYYYDLLKLDSGDDQYASELYAYYMMRNAKIFAKLLDVAGPGDRVVVVYGAGHKHFLDLLARETPGVKLVDPVPYLRSAANARN
jgi:hypothetical protein